MKILKSLVVSFHKINSTLIEVAGALIVIAVMADTVDIMMRYLLRKSWGGISELSEYSLVWITFLGTAWLLKKNAHVRMDMIPNMLGKRNRAIADIIANYLSLLPIFLAFWYTGRMVLEHFQTKQLFNSFLQLPRWPVEIVMPIGSFMLFLQALINIVELHKEWKSISREKGPPDTAIVLQAKPQSQANPGGEY